MTEQYTNEARKREAVYGPRKRNPTRWTREDFLDALEACALNIGQTPSCKMYTKWRKRQANIYAVPSPARFTQVFGRWNTAVRAAGLTPNNGTEPGHSQEFSQQECVNAVRICADALGKVPTYEQYEEWARFSDGRYPSGPTLRNRIARRWLEIIDIAFNETTGG